MRARVRDRRGGPACRYHDCSLSASIIDGKKLAESARASIRRRAGAVRDRGVEPRLDAVIVGSEDNAARVYAQRQCSTCESLGIGHKLHELNESASEDEIVSFVHGLGADDGVTAIMVHMPLPAGVDEDAVKAAIAPAKDVEGVTPANIGNVVYGRSTLAPSTGLAAMRLIESTGLELRGQRAVVIGASATVGRPLAALLMQREATVVSCNKYTWGIEDLARSGDVLIAAAGVPELVTPDWVKPGAVVIDIGINRVERDDGTMRTVGDVAFEQVRAVAGWISPVPGGVGPMTVAMLLGNVVDAAEKRAERLAE